jgi:crotonobetainyl-CoA:carnitine CoA-transferase CaiB-like acyl-CoA transferase
MVEKNNIQLLRGIKVLEVANFISGPYAATLLGDLGAEVVKVENPESGDAFRSWGTEDRSASFFAFNRGKKSIAMNLRTEAAQKIVLRLASEADVFVENFRPGWLDEHGLGYEAVSRVNPRIIYCQISGFGESGPDRDKPAYDGVAQARSGLWSHLSSREQEWIPVGPPIADQLSGLFAAYGILAAMFQREQTGEGMLVSTDMVSAALGFLTSSVAEYTVGGKVRGPYDRPRGSQCFGWECSDGKAFAVHLSSPTKFWQGLLLVAGRPELNDDERFNTRRLRVINYEALRLELATVFATAPRQHWIEKLEEANVPVAPINDIAEVLEDPQVLHNRVIRSFGQGDRHATLVGSPIRFGRSGEYLGPEGGERAEPFRGEDTRAVLESLGFGVSEIDELARTGAIGISPDE